MFWPCFQLLFFECEHTRSHETTTPRASNPNPRFLGSLAGASDRPSTGRQAGTELKQLSYRVSGAPFTYTVQQWRLIYTSLKRWRKVLSAYRVPPCTRALRQPRCLACVCLRRGAGAHELATASLERSSAQPHRSTRLRFIGTSCGKKKIRQTL